MLKLLIHTNYFAEIFLDPDLKFVCEHYLLMNIEEETAYFNKNETKLSKRQTNKEYTEYLGED